MRPTRNDIILYMNGNRRLSHLLKPLLRRGWGGLVLLLLATPLPAQTAFVWQAGAQAFFDNEEYARSAVQSPQTMAGVHLAPQVGVSWQGRHRVFAGVDALKEFGTDRVIDRADLMAYYEFESPAFHFRMGAFPRRDVLDRYPRMFFQDSVAYFRPVMTGLFWEYHRPRGYFNVWLDWTGRQAEGRRETFFMGWSGRYQYGVFYAQHFGYMYHFARSKHPAVPEHLHDNGLLLVSAGVDLHRLARLDKLEANAGWSAGLERDRDDGTGAWHVPQGFLAELAVEWRGIGLFNTYYRGAAQQRFYPQYGNALYWGDTFYRTREYNRTDLYVQFFRSPVVDVRFTASFHLAERHLYNSQSLTASFHLDNFSQHNGQPYRPFWDGWFRKNDKHQRQ